MGRDQQRLLLHPVVLGALLLWVVNDHCLKAAWGHPLTGKLSDLAGFVAAPVLLAALAAELRLDRLPRQRALAACCALTVMVMTAIKLWTPAAEAYRYGLGALQWPLRCALSGAVCRFAPVRLTLDPTDLWTAPAALVPLWLARQRAAETQQRRTRKQVAFFRAS